MDQETRNYAREKLNETEETKIKCLTEIKQWLNENLHLRARSDDKYILPFLRSCKFKVDLTKEKISNYYNLKKNAAYWFTNRNPENEDIKQLVKLGVFFVLKNTYKNRLVIVIRLGAYDPSKHNLNDIIKLGMMILDVATMENEKSQIYGTTTLVDCEGFTLSHAQQLNITFIKNMVSSWRNYHCRPQQIEFFNTPVFVNVFLNLFKSFLTSKVKGRVRVHYDIETVHRKLHNIQDVLPEEYGGESEKIGEMGEYWYKKLVEYKEWFEEDEMYTPE